MEVSMCEFAVQIPDEVLYDTHMTESQSQTYIKKLVAMHYYLHFHVSLGYCAQIADTNEEDFIKFLSENKVSIFQFENPSEFQEELKNA